MRFIAPTIKNEFNLIESSLSPIMLQGREEEASEYIAKTYAVEATVMSVEHPDFNRDFRIVLSEEGKRRFLDGWGDGSKYGVAILLFAINMKDSGLFIEEIEKFSTTASIASLSYYFC